MALVEAIESPTFKGDVVGSRDRRAARASRGLAAQRADRGRLALAGGPRWW
jgi:hypothetical protein